jgi:integrase/recombinase XerD
MTCILGRDPARRCLTVAAWPTADRLLWQAALVPGDILEPGGDRARYSAISNRNVARSYGRWLGWLDHTGQLQADVPPGSRLTREAVVAWLAALQGYNGTATQLSRLEQLYQAALIMAPGTDWSWIRRLASRIRANHRPVRPKRPRMVSAAELYGLGCRLMAVSPTDTPRQQATRYRDGLMSRSSPLARSAAATWPASS